MSGGGTYSYKITAGSVDLATLILGMATSGLAETPPSPSHPRRARPTEAASVEISPGLRKHLFEMYQKMSECLTKSDKTLQDCQVEVRKECPVAAALGYCSLQDGIGQLKGGSQPGKVQPRKKD
jgi:hypothetical protein